MHTKTITNWERPLQPVEPNKEDQETNEKTQHIDEVSQSTEQRSEEKLDDATDRQTFTEKRINRRKFLKFTGVTSLAFLLDNVISPIPITPKLTSAAFSALQEFARRREKNMPKTTKETIEKAVEEIENGLNMADDILMRYIPFSQKLGYLDVMHIAANVSYFDRYYKALDEAQQQPDKSTALEFEPGGLLFGVVGDRERYKIQVSVASQKDPSEKEKIDFAMKSAAELGYAHERNSKRGIVARYNQNLASSFAIEDLPSNGMGLMLGGVMKKMGGRKNFINVYCPEEYAERKGKYYFAILYYLAQYSGEMKSGLDKDIKYKKGKKNLNQSFLPMIDNLERNNPVVQFLNGIDKHRKSVGPDFGNIERRKGDSCPVKGGGRMAWKIIEHEYLGI